MATRITSNGLAPRELSAEEQMILDFWLRMPRQKRRILLPVFEAYDDATNPEEKQMILGTLTESLFRTWEDFWGERAAATDVATSKLQNHRQHVAQALKTLRGKAGLTQAQLAEKSGLPQSHISNLENAKHAATYKTIQRLAAALNTKPSMIDTGFTD